MKNDLNLDLNLRQELRQESKQNNQLDLMNTESLSAMQSPTRTSRFVSTKFKKPLVPEEPELSPIILPFDSKKRKKVYVAVTKRRGKEFEIKGTESTSLYGSEQEGRKCVGSTIQENALSSPMELSEIQSYRRGRR